MSGETPPGQGVKGSNPLGNSPALPGAPPGQGVKGFKSSRPIIMIHRLRLLVQHVSMVIMLYGGRFGIRLGPGIPCFACPYVVGCGGQCYLMGLQGYYGFGLSFASLGGPLFFRALMWMAVFIGLTALLGKLWCGWICPFGLILDWLTGIRKALGVRERKFSPRLQKTLSPIKYILLAYAVALPPLVTANILSDGFFLPFCNICPGKSILPLFAGNASYFALNFTNTVTLVFSILLLVITGVTLAGSFFKERFFCYFCPLLALMNLIKPITMLRLTKQPLACTGCASCRRSCPMNIDTVYLEKEKTDVQTGHCIDCFQCTETCSARDALSVKFLGKRLFAARRRYAAKRSIQR